MRLCTGPSLLAIALMACDGEAGRLAELLKTQRPGIERNLSALPSLASQARTLPPLERDGATRPLAVVLDALADPGDRINASLAYAEDLATADELGYVWGRIEGSGALNHCASLLHRGHLAYDPALPAQSLLAIDLEEAQLRFPRCAAYGYLFVVRSLEFLRPSTPVAAKAPFVPIAKTVDLDAVPAEPPVAPPPKKKRRGRGKAARPVVVEDAPADTDATLLPTDQWSRVRETRYLFDGGFLRAEVLFFELPGATFLGGARFTAQSNVKVKGDGEVVQTDFADQVKAALGKAVRDAVTRTSGEDKP